MSSLQEHRSELMSSPVTKSIESCTTSKPHSHSAQRPCQSHQHHHNHNHHHHRHHNHRTSFDGSHHSHQQNTLKPNEINLPTIKGCNNQQPNLEIHHPQKNHLPIGHHYIAIKDNSLHECDEENEGGPSSVSCGGGGGVDSITDDPNNELNDATCELSTQNVAKFGAASCDDNSYPSGSEESGRRRIRNEKNRVKVLSNRLNDQKYINGIEVYSDGADSGVKVTDEGTSADEDQVPPLPPRPPPRVRNFLLDETGKNFYNFN